MATPSPRIFRQVALDRLSSPDQLDRLITVTSSFGWASVVAVVVLLAAIAAWSVLGNIPTRVEGTGILVARGGQVFNAMAAAAGSLATVAPIGAKVTKGEVVATLDDTQSEQDLEHAKNVLREQQAQLAQLVARFDHEAAVRHQVDAQQRENLGDTIRNAEQRQAFYAEELKSDQPLTASGFLTRRFLQETRQQMEAAGQEAQRARNDRLRIDAEDLNANGEREQALLRQQDAVNAAQRQVDELKIRLDRSTRIVSPIDGHVTEVKASAGTVVELGRPILSIETAGKKLELLLFIPPEQGKKVTRGMAVRIEPATVKKEEFGTLAGRVEDISEFPISPEGMLAELGNPELVKLFSTEGAPYAAHVRLVSDAANPSGYAWSAGRGPQVTLSAGTTATAEVTVHNEAPIVLVLPLLREKTGIEK